MNQQLRDQYRQALRRVLEGTGSKFTIVQFIKQDGSLRTMLIQHAATKFRVKGVADKLDTMHTPAARAVVTRAANHPELFNTYDVDRNAIRSVNLDTVTRIRSFGRDIYKAPDGYVRSLTKEVA